MALTQARGYAAHTGRRYGEFARGRPVEQLTQPSAFGPHTHGRYGTFAGKTPSTPPVRRAVTQLRAFGGHSGQRYGAFAKTPSGPVIRPGIVIVPDNVLTAQRRKLLQRDEVLLMIAAAIATGVIH